MTSPCESCESTTCSDSPKYNERGVDRMSTRTATRTTTTTTTIRASADTIRQLLRMADTTVSNSFMVAPDTTVVVPPAIAMRLLASDYGMEYDITIKRMVREWSNSPQTIMRVANVPTTPLASDAWDILDMASRAPIDYRRIKS